MDAKRRKLDVSHDVESSTTSQKDDDSLQYGQKIQSKCSLIFQFIFSII